MQKFVMLGMAALLAGAAVQSALADQTANRTARVTDTVRMLPGGFRAAPSMAAVDTKAGLKGARPSLAGVTPPVVTRDAVHNPLMRRPQ